VGWEHGELGTACKIGFGCRERGHEAEKAIIADVGGGVAKPAFTVAGNTGVGLSISEKEPIRAVTLPAWCRGMFGNNAFHDAPLSIGDVKQHVGMTGLAVTGAPASKVFAAQINPHLP
jgi:hypothetical protein